MMVQNGVVFVNEVKIIFYDILCINGVIYFIDGVLLLMEGN